MNTRIATSEYWLWAYRLLLGREPEHPEALDKLPDISRLEILEKFLGSPEFLRSLWMANSQDYWFLAEMSNGVRFWVRAGDQYVSRSVVAGNYEPAETFFVRRHVKKGMRVLDIGANIGWFTVNMALLVGSDGHVDAFEPRDDIAFYLGRTVLENKLNNVTVHKCALAATDGRGRISFGKDDRNPGGTHLELGETASWNVSQDVQVRRLDSAVWRPIDFIKIDAEGAEKLVLDGANLTLDRDRPIILTEVNQICLQRTSRISGADYLRLLEGRGYIVTEILPNRLCGERITPENLERKTEVRNFGCLPEERAAEFGINHSEIRR